MLLTLKAVAERLNASLSTVYSHVESGRLPVICTGATKGFRVSEEDLQTFIESRRKGREPQPWPEKANPKSKGTPFVMLDGERLREAWRRRGADTR
jgi:excisionase family DNA binding protein